MTQLITDFLHSFHLQAGQVDTVGEQIILVQSITIEHLYQFESCIPLLSVKQ